MLLNKSPRGGLGPSEEVGGTFDSTRSGKVDTVECQSPSRCGSGCPTGAKTPEGIHGRSGKAKSSLTRPDGGGVSSMASIGGSTVGTRNIGHVGMRPSCPWMALGHISRKAMLEGLLSVERGDQLLPFVRSFYDATSTYMWEDDMGTKHRIPQGEGEEGNKLTPSCLYFSVWVSIGH